MTGEVHRFPPPGEEPLLDPVDDPELADVAHVVRGVLHQHRMRPEARDLLRAELMAAARAQLHEKRSAPPFLVGGAEGTGPWTPPEPGAHRRPEPAKHDAGKHEPRPSRSRYRRTPALGWSAVAAAAALALFVVAQTGLGRQRGGAPAIGINPAADVISSVSADAGKGFTVTFSRAMDDSSVTAGLHLSPALAISTGWRGNTLTVTPRHGFAPNAAYVLTIDHGVARTATGAELTSDLHVVFSMPPQVQVGAPVADPAALPRAGVAAAAAGSEAVVTGGGSLLLTAASTGARHGTGTDQLLRIENQATQRLAGPAAAVCVSRSGRSVAYLEGSGSHSTLVFADAFGSAQGSVPVQADPGTPLGWVGDSAVSLVSAGKLIEVDRSGTVRPLAGVPVDTRHDDLAIAPGGRYVYLAKGSRPGDVIDLVTGLVHPLDGAVGRPAFSADGSTVVWLQAHGSSVSLDSAPSGGGQTWSAPLALRSGDLVSDLAVSPDGSLLAYSVTHRGGTAELRLASLPDGRTLAVSRAGAGQSPNWAPSGRMFTVLGQVPGGHQIQTVAVPAGLLPSSAAPESLARAFGNAQLGSDLDAQHALAADGVSIPPVTGMRRLDLLSVQASGDGTATAQLRLAAVPTAAQPVPDQLQETLTIGPGPNGTPEVTALVVGPRAPAPAGPQLTAVDTRSNPGAVLLSFDSDLDPLTVPAAVSLVTAGGPEIAATTGYDPATRTVTLRPATQAGLGSGAMQVVIGSSLRDVDGQPLATPVQLPVQLAGTP